MELTLQLETHADIDLIKKILSQIKGIKSVEISGDKTYSWEEIESSENFKKVIEQSRKEIENGEGVEMTDELLDSIFRKKWKLFLLPVPLYLFRKL